jgi:hypothetical protein
MKCASNLMPAFFELSNHDAFSGLAVRVNSFSQLTKSPSLRESFTGTKGSNRRIVGG